MYVYADIRHEWIPARGCEQKYNYIVPLHLHLHYVDVTIRAPGHGAIELL